MGVGGGAVSTGPCPTPPPTSTYRDRILAIMDDATKLDQDETWKGGDTRKRIQGGYSGVQGYGSG